MLKIDYLEISSFRSILNLRLKILHEPNLISICGENNVGKTNTLRAINLFFNPDEYDLLLDKPTLKQAQGGARIAPKITVILYDDIKDEYYKITRDFKFYNKEDLKYLVGTSYKKRGTQIDSKSKKNLSISEVKNKLEEIEFRFIESINIDIPELIDRLTSNAIDVEYEQSRMTKSKQKLKDAYIEYTTGLQKFLDVFSEEISQTFNNFKNNWNVKFKVPTSSDTFRDLISDDVELLIDDKGCREIEQKGSGLQRLAVILLNFEIIKRIKNKKNYILCIDEPDIFLHEGLQIKLMEFFKENSNKMQIFYTTHSKNFINPYSMKNIVLLGSKHYPQYSVRKRKNIDVVETYFIDTNTEDGYNIICEQLGIETEMYELLQPNNLLVEGNCDKKYLTEMIKYFELKCPNIESLNGADNAIKFLEFYDAYYKNNTNRYIPKIKVVLDNDIKGREIYNKIKKNTYNYIKVKPILIQNHNNNANIEFERNNTNNEIEDFLYPEVIVYLINALLDKKGMKKLNIISVSRKIHTKSFATKGILELCEFEKNILNPERGAELSFVSSGNQANRIKEGLAGLFNLKAQKKLLSLLEDCDKKYPYVRQALQELCDFRDDN